MSDETDQAAPIPFESALDTSSGPRSLPTTVPTVSAVLCEMSPCAIERQPEEHQRTRASSVRAVGKRRQDSGLMSMQVKTWTWPPCSMCGWSSHAEAAASSESASMIV